MPALVGGCASLALAAPAGALADGDVGGLMFGEAPPAPASAAPPSVDAVTCRTGCLGVATAVPGSRVRVSGSSLAGVTRVVFLGARGGDDDVSAAAVQAGDDTVDVTLPAGAVSGRVRVVSAGRSRMSRARLTVASPGSAQTAASGTVEARVQSRRVYVDGDREATLDVFVPGGAAADVVVDVVRPSDGGSLAHFVLPAVAGGTVQSVAWDGRAGGRAQPEGRYAFRVSVPGAAVRAAQIAGAPAEAGFVLLRHHFPIDGPHRYGQDFGAGRGHQGVDVFAACGTRLVAVREGKVKFAGHHARAGNYVVIAGTRFDHVYMHLRDVPLVEKGDTVATGAPVGFVGDSGHADGCHLHFELWSAPGWYTGGRPVDPLPHLKAWDGEG